jgi:hypothetical protein
MYDPGEYLRMDDNIKFSVDVCWWWAFWAYIECNACVIKE